MANKFANLSTGTVATAPSPATSGTSLVLQSGEGARMPAVPFYATVGPEGELPTFDNAEIIQVTAVSTDTLTIVRAQKDTTARSIATDWRLSASIYAEDLDGYQAPIGAVVGYGGTTEPDGWLFCYGQAISRATYSELFTAIGTTYGVGDGSTTFNLPDIRGRVIAGQDDMGGSSANRLTDSTTQGIEGDTLGAVGGEEDHVQTEDELATHTHIQDPHRHLLGKNTGSSGGFGLVDSGTASSSGQPYTGYATATNQNTGSSDAFNVVQPTIILNYIIKATQPTTSPNGWETASATLTNKTLDGDENSISNIPSEGLKATVGFYATTTQSITTATVTPLTSYTEVVDYGGDFASGVFTAPVDGLYHFDINIAITDMAVDSRLYAYLLVNSSTVSQNMSISRHILHDPGVNCSITIPLSATDTVSGTAYQDGGTTKSLTASSFSGHLVGTA